MTRGKEGAAGLAGGLRLPLPDYFGHGWIMTDSQEARAQRGRKWSSRGVISSLCSLSGAGFPGPGLANMGRWGRHDTIRAEYVRRVCIQVWLSVPVRVNFKGRRAGDCGLTVCVYWEHVCTCRCACGFLRLCDWCVCCVPVCVSLSTCV